VPPRAEAAPAPRAGSQHHFTEKTAPTPACALTLELLPSVKHLLDVTPHDVLDVVQALTEPTAVGAAGGVGVLALEALQCAVCSGAGERRVEWMRARWKQVHASSLATALSLTKLEIRIGSPQCVDVRGPLVAVVSPQLRGKLAVHIREVAKHKLLGV